MRFRGDRSRLSRRGLLQATATGVAVAGASTVPSVSAGQASGATSLPAEVLARMQAPRYRAARWGLFVADRASGDVLYDLNADALVLPASTTKLFSTAAALDAYGAEYRFETPVYRRGDIDSDGTLHGDLILVASGDLTMGGRDTPDGRIAFTPLDH